VRAPGKSSAVAGVELGHVVLADEWSELFGGPRRANRSMSPSPSSERFRRTQPSYLQGPTQQPGWYTPRSASRGSWSWDDDDDDEPRYRRTPWSEPRSGGYRTVCVRLCDGYAFPISFSASEWTLSRDQMTCSNACPGARLYHGYSRGGVNDLNDMVDLTGQPYARLKTANLFRTQYVEDCKCKPHPWEQASVDRHRMYALEEQRRKGNRAVVAELEQLRRKVFADTRSDSRYYQPVRRAPAQQSASASPEQTVPPAITDDRLPAPRSDASRGQAGGDSAALVSPATISVGPSAPGGLVAEPVPVAEPQPTPAPVEVTRPEVPRHNGGASLRAREPRAMDQSRPQERATNWVRRAFDQ
jgi:hypothetical protein